MSPKKLKFCENYLVDLNATQAAIRAGYSKRTARSQGQRLLTNVDVQEKIAELQKQAREATELTRDEILKTLASIIRAEVPAYFDENEKLKNFATLTKAEKQAIDSIKVGKRGVLSFRLSSKLQAIQTVNRMLGWEAPQDLNIQLESLSEEVLDTIIEKLITKKSKML